MMRVQPSAAPTDARPARCSVCPWNYPAPSALPIFWKTILSESIKPCHSDWRTLPPSRDSEERDMSVSDLAGGYRPNGASGSGHLRHDGFWRLTDQ